MLKKLLKKLKGMSERAPLDPRQFNDPLAEQIDWTPLKPGGTNIKTHKLRKIHAQRMEFRCSLSMLLFGGIFFLLGVGVLIGAIIAFFNRTPDTPRGIFVFLPLFGLIFGAVGFFMLRGALAPRVFDLAHGYYCRDRKKPEHAFDPSTITDHVRLTEIHALQLLSEYCRGDKSSYYSYELNLVLKDGSRINVVDHGGRSAIQRDARTLSEFLGKPLWAAH
ncbi:MAG: hypothetical protein R3242_08830 [Akkermansiaceae bacterium]|nr:hypothetical protein [Akkermansiaceae bacterium]